MLRGQCYRDSCKPRNWHVTEFCRRGSWEAGDEKPASVLNWNGSYKAIQLLHRAICPVRNSGRYTRRVDQKSFAQLQKNEWGNNKETALIFSSNKCGLGSWPHWTIRHARLDRALSVWRPRVPTTWIIVGLSCFSTAPQFQHGEVFFLYFYLSLDLQAMSESGNGRPWITAKFTLSMHLGKEACWSSRRFTWYQMLKRE